MGLSANRGGATEQLTQHRVRFSRGIRQMGGNPMSDNRPSIRHLPPGLSATTVAHGFDAANWNFVYAPIFELSYKERDPDQGIGVVTLRHGSQDNDYDVPDGMTVLPHYEQRGTEAMIFRGVHSVDEQKFSTSVGASLGTEGVSASTSFSIASSSRIETGQTWSTTVISYYKTIYSLHRDRVGDLTPAFKAELAQLPATYTPDSDSKFKEFFQKWGTHYLVRGHFGGNWVMSTIIQESILDKLDTEEIKSSVETTFDEGVVSGSAKADIEKNTSKSLNIQDKSTHIRWHTLGGDSDKELNDWLNSVDIAVELLNDVLSIATDKENGVMPLFDPIWKLVADVARQKAVSDALAAYLPPEQAQDDTVPPPISPLLNQNYQAATAGFLTAWVNTNNQVIGAEIHAHNDGNSDPKMERSAAGVHTSANDHMASASLFTPVRAKDWYSITDLPGHPGTTQIFFQPFPLDLGEWATLSVNQLYTGRDQDGFVVATIAYAQDGARGSIIGKQMVNGTLIACAASSVHLFRDADVFVAVESFCMPVVKGSDFQIDFVPTSNSPSVTVYWIPMGPSHRMRPVQFFSPNLGNQAQSNGILTAFLFCAADRSMGNLDIEVSDSPDFKSTTVITRTTVELYPVSGLPLPLSMSDKYVPYNSASALVRKGTWFRANCATAMGTVTPTVSWVGILPA
jgi:MAC/Perforin domain-containing protein